MMWMLLTAVMLAWSTLSPVDNGLVPPSVPNSYHGIGVEGKCEVLTQRALYNLANCVMACERQVGDDPICMSTCEGSYAADTTDGGLKQQGATCPACLEREAREQAGADLESYLRDVIVPQIYCDGWTQDACADHENAQAYWLVRQLARVQLETAIDEITPGYPSLGVKVRVLKKYNAVVSEMDECNSTCLTLGDRLSIGQQIFTWMGEHSSAPFCEGQ